MAVDADGNWDGVCACGKKEADGIRCFLGATHETLEVSQAKYWELNPRLKPQPTPWAAPSIPVTVVEPSFPWVATPWK